MIKNKNLQRSNQIKKFQRSQCLFKNKFLIDRLTKHQLFSQWTQWINLNSTKPCLLVVKCQWLSIRSLMKKIQERDLTWDLFNVMLLRVQRKMKDQFLFDQALKMMIMLNNNLLRVIKDQYKMNLLKNSQRVIWRDLSNLKQCLTLHKTLHLHKIKSQELKC